MNSKRIKTLVSLIDSDMKVIDVGTDHGYVPILLRQRNISVVGCDIHLKALASARKNILMHHMENDISLYLSDGLNNVDVKGFDTLVIAGVGEKTIEHILSNEDKLKDIKNLVLQANNAHDQLRLFLNQKNFKLVKEVCLFEKKKWYVIMKFSYGKEVLSKEEILFGKYNLENKAYYEYKLNDLRKILPLVPNKEEVLEKIRILDDYLSK